MATHMISSDRTGNRIDVRVDGEVDLATVHHLEAHLDEAMKVAAVDLVVVDLSRCSFMDSTGISVLARSCPSAGRSGPAVRVGPASDSVRRILQTSGLEGLIARDW